MSEKTGHEGHRARMRERFVKQGGFEGFAEHEIMEMLLFYIYPRGNTNQIAHDLVSRFGTVRNCLLAPPEALKEVPYVGDSCIFALKFFEAAAKHTLKENYSNVNAGDPYALHKFLIEEFRFVGYEKVMMYTVTEHGEIKEAYCVGRGDRTGVEVDHNRIMAYSVLSDCDMMLIAHNHPDGPSTPSGDDIRTTREIMNTLSEYNKKLFDHCVVGVDGVTSMRVEGMIRDLY